MKCGIVGLGDIAQKAYLPVISRMSNLELVLCTRNQETLAAVGREYRLNNRVNDLNALIDSGIKAAFVHTATESHYDIVRTLLQSDIHVYVDKPISYHYEQCRELVELAEQRELILMTGFNRRFAPMVAALAKITDRTSVIMQKNRSNHPASARTFIFDDFIHVLDTVRFLAPGPVENMDFDARLKDGNLLHVLVKLSGTGFTCIASMGRDFGVNEEIIEITAPGQKSVVRSLNETTRYIDNQEQVSRFGDWVPVLYRRGFDDIIAHFLESVTAGSNPTPDVSDSLLTHEICEQLAASLETK